MKKLALFMLMAVGLLVSTTMFAAPERPVPPEPKAPEGVEMPEMNVPEHPALPERTFVKKSFNKVAKAPRKAPMGDGTAIAKIGEVEYTSLQAAFDAARDAGIQTTINVIDDITESNELWIYGNSDIILELNGKTITFGTNSINISYSLEDGYSSTLNDKLTIVDNSQAKNGKIIGQGFPIYNGGTTIISDVTIESTDDGSTNYGQAVNNYATMTINSGHLLGKFAGAYNEGTMYVKGGTIESTVEEDYYGYGLSNYGIIEMTGGTVKGSGDYAVAIRNKVYTGYPSKITVTGGTINGLSYYGTWSDGTMDISNVTITGYAYNTANSINTAYTNCTINGTTYLYASAMLKNCSLQRVDVYGGTDTLVDCSLSNYMFLPSSSTANVTIKGSKTKLAATSIYVYEGECTVEAGIGGLLKVYGGTLNIKGGTFTNANNWNTMYVTNTYGKPTLNISGGTIANTYPYNSQTDYGYGIYCAAACDINISGNPTISGVNAMDTPKDAVINIEGNPLISGKEACAWYANGGTLKVYGGTFHSDQSNSIVNVGTLSVYGGFFDAPAAYQSSGDPFSAIYNTTTLHLFGGTFKNTVVAIHDEEKGVYDYDDNGDGTYTVRKIIAQIAGSNVNYFSLQDAIDAAGNEGEIALIADTEEDVIIGGAPAANGPKRAPQNVTSDSKEITLDANKHTLTGSITVTNDAVVNIMCPEGGTIDGELNATKEQLKIYSGNFTSDPTPFVQTEENCESATTETGYSVSQGVAKVGEGVYPSFAKAIEKANTLEDATVTLLANARLSNEALNVNKSMTIDLNGHSLASVSVNTSYLRFGKEDTEVTIKNGTITNAATASQFSEGLVSLSANNQVTLDNVTINHKAKAAVTLLTATAKLIVNSNCTVNSKEYGVYMGNGILENNTTSVIVGVGDNDAQITNNADASMTLVTNGMNTKTLTLSNQGSLEITDGIFAGTISVDGTIAISGGVFYDAVKATVESDKVADKNWNEIRYKGEKAWDLHSASETVIATVDGLKYYSLENAIRAIAADKTEKTIILQNDVIIDDFTREYQYTIATNQYVKIDLNGNSIIAVNQTRGNNANAILFNVETKAQLVVEDNTTDKLGKITYQNRCASTWTAYTINCNGTFILNSGTIENTSATSTAFTIELGKGGVLTINGGLITHTKSYAVRYWADSQTNTQMNVNGGEIRAPRPIWTQLAGGNSDASPYVNFNMKGGKLTCTTEGGEAFYVYSYGQSLGNIKINVTGGIINGHFSIGGGSSNGGHGNEDITINGGTFESSNSFKSYKRGVENNTIFGGAFFFGSETTANDYIRFCEYIGKGHYAVKMCRDDVNGTYTNDKIDGRYNLCEGDDCGDGTFWAIIDGEGEKEPQDVNKNGEWSDDPDKGVFDKIPDIHTDVNISGDTVEIMSGVDAEANRVVIEEGSGIIVHDGATLNVGTGGIEVNGEGTGTTFILVEAGGTVVANGTVISQKVDEIRVEANASGVGTVLLEPSLDYNNQPMSTVEMYTYARYIPEQNKYIWQHFGIPTYRAPDDITNNRSCASQFWQWNYELGDWEQVKYKQKQVNTPFRGYNLKTNYEGTDGVIYTFTGKILGNGDATFDLKPGFNFYANSYLAPINASTLINEIEDNNVEWTVWMYDGRKDNFDMINEISLLFGEDSEIPALRGFFLKLSSGSGSSTGINYESTVWKNAMNKAGISNAPARKAAADDMSLVQISLVDNLGKGDKMYLAQSNQFDATFNNGFDASKQMSEESANLYAQTIAGDLAIVATDNLDGLYLSINTKSENVYTMTFSHQSGEVFELIDLYEGQIVYMTEGASYTFVAQENTEFSNRFQVRKIYNAPTDNELIKSNNKTNKGIYTPLGQYLGNANEWTTLPAGVYVIDGQKIVK